MRRVPLRMMTLALTGACNLKCRYCYQNAKTGRPMSCAVLRAAADRLLESTDPGPELVFAGGEPLLALGTIRHAVQYIERRRSRDSPVRYNLATNGTLLSSEAIAFLRERRFAIQLSFDGVPPAQSMRGARSFTLVDAALDRLRLQAPEIFWRRLTVGVTLDANAVPYLAESFRYFVDRHVPAIAIAPVNGQSTTWTPHVLETLEQQLTEIVRISRRHFVDTGRVPLAALQRTANEPRARRGALCGAATSGNVTVDLDGETYACPFLAESSQRFANPRLAATVQPMRVGHIAHPDFWRRLAQLPARAEDTRMFRIGPDRRSLHGRCIECPYRAECTACPVSVLSEPEWDDVQRIPDYICAFNWTLMSLRRKFPVQPDAAALLQGRAAKPRLVRELLEKAEAAR